MSIVDSFPAAASTRQELELVGAVRKAHVVQARASVAQGAARGDARIRADETIGRAFPPIVAAVGEPQLVQRLAARTLG